MEISQDIAGLSLFSPLQVFPSGSSAKPSIPYFISLFLPIHFGTGSSRTRESWEPTLQFFESHAPGTREERGRRLLSATAAFLHSGYLQGILEITPIISGSRMTSPHSPCSHHCWLRG